MAKSKRAAALFEVIHSGKDADRSLLNTPRWWFKKKDKSANGGTVASLGASTADAASAPPAHDENDPTTRPIHSPLTGAHSTAHHDNHATSTSHAPHRQHDGSARSHESGGASGGDRAGLDVAVDRERQVITFKFSFTSAIVMGFSLVVAVALAYVIGQKMSRGPSPAIAAQTTEQLRAGKPNPDVLNLSNARNSTPPKLVEREADEGTISRGPDHNPDHVVDPRGNDANANGTGTANGVGSLPVAPPAINGKRTLNLNYVVIQSYPDEKSAAEARDALLKAGIGCTVEQKLRGLNANWFTVVGTQGFDRARGPDYETYLRKIAQVSDQHSKSKRSFKSFTPLAYKWDKS